MHFQIYIPGVQVCAPELLEQVGLGSLAAGFHFVGEPVGPDSKGGVVVLWKHGAPGTAGYKPAAQDWLPALGNGEQFPAGRYWIGFTKEQDPTPQELQRPYAYPGEVLAFGDGRGWLLPQLHRLPQEMTAEDDGTWRFIVQRQFYDLWLDAKAWAPVLANRTEYTLELYATLADFVLKVLALNYRITPEVVNRLRLFTAGDGSTVALAAALICDQLLRE